MIIIQLDFIIKSESQRKKNSLVFKKSKSSVHLGYLLIFFMKLDVIYFIEMMQSAEKLNSHIFYHLLNLSLPFIGLVGRVSSFWSYI